MQETVSFDSHGLKLSGVVRIPDNAKGKVPAFLLLHGFGSIKEAHWMYLTAELLAKWGYASIRFDMRGCGESEGERGRVICLEQVEDTSSALTYMASRAEIDPARIGVLGHSFGAAVAVYAAGVDSRLAACISSGGWGDGPKKFRKQHASPEAWKKFTDMMEEGKKRKARGEQMMVPRWDIVPIPEHLRGNLSKGSFFRLADANPQVYREALKILTRRLRQTNDSVVAQGTVTVAGRVARAFASLAQGLGEGRANGTILLPNKITQNDIAGMAGVARENASRAINDLLRDGILTREGSFYLIARPDELEDMAEI